MYDPWFLQSVYHWIFLRSDDNYLWCLFEVYCSSRHHMSSILLTSFLITSSHLFFVFLVFPFLITENQPHIQLSLWHFEQYLFPALILPLKIHQSVSSHNSLNCFVDIVVNALIHLIYNNCQFCDIQLLSQSIVPKILGWLSLHIHNVCLKLSISTSSCWQNNV